MAVLGVDGRTLRKCEALPGNGEFDSAERAQVHFDARQLVVPAGVVGEGFDRDRAIQFAIDPVEQVGSQVLFEMAAVPRLRLIQRLRSDIGVNLAGVAVILDMLDRLRASQGENERLRSQL